MALIKRRKKSNIIQREYRLTLYRYNVSIICLIKGMFLFNLHNRLFNSLAWKSTVFILQIVDQIGK